MPSNDSPQSNESDSPGENSPNDQEKMLSKIARFFDKFIGDVGKRTDESVSRYDEVKRTLDEGDALPLQREWERLEAKSSASEMVEDTHKVRVAKLWGGFLVKERRWEEARQVLEKALSFKQGIATERFDVLFVLADVLRMEGKNDEAYALLHEYPLSRQIMQIARAFPGSDTGAKLAHARFDFADEARLHLLAFSPSPLLPIESLQAEMSGDVATRRLKAALAHYYAGQISSAIEQAEQARAVSDSPSRKVSALCLLILWQTPRKGWDGITDLMNEAQSHATSPALSTQITRLQLMKASQTGDFALFEELGAKLGNDVSVQQQYAELRALQGRFEEARQWVEMLVTDAQTSDSSVSSHRKRAVALLTQVLVELYAVQSAHGWNAKAVERSLDYAREMLRGDAKMTLWIRAYEAAFSAAQGRRDETLRIAGKIGGEWDAWRDDNTSLKVLSSSLGTAFLLLKEWDQAILWFERYLEIGFNAVYRAHHLELLARALMGKGDNKAARTRYEEVVASNLDIRAVELARQALSGREL